LRLLSYEIQKYCCNPKSDTMGYFSKHSNSLLVLGNMEKHGGYLFRVGDDVEEHVSVALDAEIEAPVVVHSRLPDVL
jgi:hypothetical protein